ncbi:uncharacterized protein N7511_006402 [Penicillium nucicola]|uniref:uncharacterized protein n=1 Tax=Penicillium nucicola TaxID=1850975 RepID=UPI002545A5E8|nr:uncharacterized protein N7511_006402 [Penicillium nucicola]KAJ5757708.1 hypothetical protein N7511_006402 [Penicillium nucicola]
MACSLPLEALLHIFSFLEDDLVACACVCQQWQVAVERTTFSTLLANSSNLEELRHIVGRTSTPWRPSFIKNLDFKCIIPDYGVEARGRLEDDHDRCSNNKAFTQAITSLFEILGSWSSDDHCAIELVIYARSPGDLESEPEWTKRKIRIQQNNAFPEEDLLWERYETSYLQLTEDTHLPIVNCIEKLQVRGLVAYRGLSPRALSDIVCCLPRLRALSVDLNDNYRRNPTMQNHLRSEFSQGITNWPPSLTDLLLRYEGYPPWDQSFPAVKRSEPSADPLSLALHRLTQQLETVDLAPIMIGPELFWPAATKSIPYWPNLINIRVRFSAATPSGKWLFERDPRWRDVSPSRYPAPAWFEGEPPSEKRINPFRTMPNKELNELYIAAGRAAQQMPKLQNMTLWAEIMNFGDGLEEVIEQASDHWFQYTSSSAKATWICTSEFHVAPEVRQVWDAVAKSHRRSHLTIENLGFKVGADEFGGHKMFCNDDGGFDEKLKKEYECFSWDT